MNKLQSQTISGVQSPQNPNDKYSIHIYDAIKNFGTGPKVMPNVDTKGETTNHTEARFVGQYGLNPDSYRQVLIDFYRTGIRERGNMAGERLNPVSHVAHYIMARGAGLLFAMMAEHTDVIDAMVAVWKSDIAGFDLLSDPAGTTWACPCSRLLDGADQRIQLVSTIAWLKGRKIHQPKTIAIAPDWLGLYCLQILDKSHSLGASWAAQWPEIRQEITNAKKEGILPVRDGLVVETTKRGHRAYFAGIIDTSLDKGSSLWAWIDYNNPQTVIHGVIDPNVRNPLKWVSLHDAGAMPALEGDVIETFEFPLVGR